MDINVWENKQRRRFLVVKDLDLINSLISYFPKGKDLTSFWFFLVASWRLRKILKHRSSIKTLNKYLETISRFSTFFLPKILVITIYSNYE